jgi:hypothetical protein
VQQQSLIDGKRSSLVEGCGELIEAMAGGDERKIKHERERVSEALTEIRKLETERGGEGEVWWKIAQGLVSALSEGDKDKADYYADSLQATLGAAGPASVGVSLEEME